jgi:hypothetical protein
MDHDYLELHDLIIYDFYIVQVGGFVTQHLTVLCD